MNDFSAPDPHVSPALYTESTWSTLSSMREVRRLLPAFSRMNGGETVCFYCRAVTFAEVEQKVLRVELNYAVIGWLR